MWISVDVRSPQPIYEQIKKAVLEAILMEHIKQDDVLPSIREVAEHARVNPNTVAKAFRELEQEGVVIARQGIGYMVISDRESIKESVMKTIADDLKEPLRKLKRAGVGLQEVLEVVRNVWTTKE
ncbi:MAG TPA: GntR family transcriptional regulator [Kosmotogaceae bacterium]|nr:GntR family transcriptional regulator [Kosmotogaceae bacterium]